MALEKMVAKERKRVYLAPTGPQKAGVLPAAVAPPSRPVQKNAGETTKPRQMERPSQGRQEFVMTFEK